MPIKPLIACLLTAAALQASAAPALPPPVAAGADFYRHVNGAWEEQARIPQGSNAWGARTQLRSDNLAKLAVLYDSAGPGGAPRLAADYTAAQLDLDTIERRGLAPLRPLLASIDALRGRRALARHLGARVRLDVDPVNFGSFASEHPFGVWIAPGLDDPAHYLPYLLQGGLTLPSAATYLSAEPAERATLDALRQYIADMLRAAGASDAAARAERVVALETRIAASHASDLASADLGTARPLWRRADFNAQAPGLDWDAYLTAAAIPRRQAVAIWQPATVRAMAALLADAPLEDWKDYLRFHALNMHARFLPRSLSTRYFAFYDPIIIGPGLYRSFLDHALTQTSTDVPNAGQPFAARHFPPAAKVQASAIVANIVAVFDARLDTLSWLSDRARGEARAKLRAMRIGIGHPDSWRDTRGLLIRRDDAFGNVERVQAFNYHAALAKLGKPVARAAWIPNADLFGINLMPQEQALTIPMTELQAPYIDPDGALAASYGAIGARIARFVGLAFNDEGSRFDAQGRLRTWWSASEHAAFARAGARLMATRPGAPHSPDAARAALADLLGLNVAYAAYRRADPAAGAQEDRRFFSAYAESVRVKGAGQAAARERVALVRHMDAWYAAFDVKPDQAMYLAPQERVALW